MKFYEYLVDDAKRDGVQKICVGAVVMSECSNKVLVIKRQAGDYLGGMEELPSGGVDKGEGLYEALVREVEEETNLDVSEVVHYLGYFDYRSSSGKHSRQFNFSVLVKDEKEVVLTEHDDFKWLTLEEALVNINISDNVKHCLRVHDFNLS